MVSRTTFISGLTGRKADHSARAWSRAKDIVDKWLDPFQSGLHGAAPGPSMASSDSIRMESLSLFLSHAEANKGEKPEFAFACERIIDGYSFTLPFPKGLAVRNRGLVIRSLAPLSLGTGLPAVVGGLVGSIVSQTDPVSNLTYNSVTDAGYCEFVALTFLLGKINIWNDASGAFKAWYLQVNSK